MMLYQHHRGGLYLSPTVAASDSTNSLEGEDRLLVPYYSIEMDFWLVRDMVEFYEPVLWPDGITRPRFVRIYSVGDII